VRLWRFVWATQTSSRMPDQILAAPAVAAHGADPG
jgi:hypothetical protein